MIKLAIIFQEEEQTVFSFPVPDANGAMFSTRFPKIFGDATDSITVTRGEEERRDLTTEEM